MRGKTATPHTNSTNKTNDSSGAKDSSSVDIVEKELSYLVVGAFFTVYNTLGIGFLESIYVRSLELLLKKKGYWSTVNTQ